jgi:hypothetical protein
MAQAPIHIPRNRAGTTRLKARAVAIVKTGGSMDIQLPADSGAASLASVIELNINRQSTLTNLYKYLVYNIN